MSSPLLGAADYPEIRQQIDLSLTAQTLPDATIAQDSFIGQGMRAIIEMDPQAEAETGDAAARVRLAAIYWTAALLCPVIPMLRSVRFQQEGYDRGPWDPGKRAAELKAMAAGLIDEILTPGEVRAPFAFKVVPGYRGGRFR